MAHPIDASPAYADLAEFQPRRGSGEACFASSKYSCAVFARLQCLTTRPRSFDRRKPEAQARQRRTPFWCQRNPARIGFLTYALYHHSQTIKSNKNTMMKQRKCLLTHSKSRCAQSAARIKYQSANEKLSSGSSLRLVMLIKRKQ